MNKKDIDNIFNILSKIYNDNSLIELKYDNPYTLLVSVVLSAQATDEGVNKATKDLFKIANTPKKMLKLGQNKLNEHIKTINYHNVKSKHIIELSKILTIFGPIKIIFFVTSNPNPLIPIIKIFISFIFLIVSLPKAYNCLE